MRALAGAAAGRARGDGARRPGRWRAPPTPARTTARRSARRSRGSSPSTRTPGLRRLRADAGRRPGRPPAGAARACERADAGARRSTTGRSSSWRTPTTRCSGRAASLGPVGRLLLAYETLPGSPETSPRAGAAALARFPRPVESLRLAETAAFGAAAWPEPLETADGAGAAAGPATMRGFDRRGLPRRLRRAGGAAAPRARRRVRTRGHPQPLGRVRPRGPRAAVPRRRRAPGRARLRALGARPTSATARPALMRRNLGRLGGRPTAPLPTDRDARRRPEGALPRDRLPGPGSTTTPGPTPRSSTRCCRARPRRRRRAAATR